MESQQSTRSQFFSATVTPHDNLLKVQDLINSLMDQAANSTSYLLQAANMLNTSSQTWHTRFFSDAMDRLKSRLTTVKATAITETDSGLKAIRLLLSVNSSLTKSVISFPG